MPAGRPTKYTPELLQKAKDYIACYKELTDNEEVIPSHQGLAKHLDISTVCLYEWAKHEDKQEFSNILDQCLREQHLVLINKGLKGDFNSAIVKLALGKHGYSDKQETELSGSLEVTKVQRTIVDPGHSNS